MHVTRSREVPPVGDPVAQRRDQRGVFLALAGPRNIEGLSRASLYHVLRAGGADATTALAMADDLLKERAAAIRGRAAEVRSSGFWEILAGVFVTGVCIVMIFLHAAFLPPASLTLVAGFAGIVMIASGLCKVKVSDEDYIRFTAQATVVGENADHAAAGPLGKTISAPRAGAALLAFVTITIGLGWWILAGG